MLSLNKLTKDRTQGADRIVIPENVMTNNVGTIRSAEVQELLNSRHYPFHRCILEFGDDKTQTYFEVIDADEVAVIRDMRSGNNVVFSAIINLGTLTVKIKNGTITVDCPDVRAAAFRQHKRLRVTESQIEEVRQTLAIEILSILCVFAYINRVCLAEPEIEEKAVKRHTKKKSRNNGSVRYISTRKYVLTGQERKSRRGVPKIYTRESWQTRGHWRTYKSGKRVWIKPHENRRDRNKLNGKRTDARIYKVGL